MGFDPIEIIEFLKKRLKEVVFGAIFFIGAIYILFIESELYQSDANIVVRDLTSKTTDISGLSLLLSPSSSSQDSFILEAYLKSFDEFEKLDKEFQLRRHFYRDLDIVQRAKPWSTKEDLLELYRKHLVFVYDQTAGLVTLGYLHTDPKMAYEITKQLIKDANDRLNAYNKLVAKKQLEYLRKQVEENKRKLEESIKKLEEFQNKYMELDPSQTAQSQMSLLANLEATLVEKTAKLSDLRQYMSEKSFEVKRLRNEVANLKQTIAKIKKALANPEKKSINVFIFEFERLKTIVELNKELYRQSLLQLEQLKAEIGRNSKMLLLITKPYVPQGYRYPEKFKDLVTLALILALLYGIVSLIGAIIKEHLD